MTAPLLVPSLPQVSSFLLDLYRGSNELGYRELLARCMEQLQGIFPFDSGLFGVGTIRNGVPQGHDITLFRQPQAFMDSWEQAKHQDRVALEAFGCPGRTVNHSIDDPFFEGCDAVVSHARAWGLSHILCTGCVLMDVGLYWVMSLYRAESGRPFSEAERATKELLVPHIIAASRQARLGRLRAASQHTEDYGPTTAIVDREGVVLEAEPGLIELLRAEWPGWVGPWLPPELIERLRGPEAQRLLLRRLVLRSDEVDGVRLLHVRRTVVADRLTARERQIAEAFSTGESYREIGERIGIAPNTVRRHLANIYEKLGISSKVELDRMLGAG